MKLVDAFDAFLIDLDGVVWRGDVEIAGAAEAIDVLREMGKRVVFVTNNSSRSPRDYAMKLMRMRIPTEPGDVITSAHAVVAELRELALRRGDRVHLFGTDGFAQVLRSAGLEPTSELEDVKALVVGWNPQMTFTDLRRAADVARTGVPFVGANRDATYPDENGLAPGSGSILAAIETASGRTATVVGKPGPRLFQMAIERAGSAPDRSVFVGDRADSDIAGARAAQIPVVLVLTGVTSEADVATLTERPDWILEALADVLTAPGSSAPAVVPIVEDVPVDDGDVIAPPAPAEREDQEHPGDEPADVSEERDAAATLFHLP